MGVERAVTRWYLQRQSILNEIAALEAMLLIPAPTQSEKQVSNENTQQDLDIIHKLTSAQARLRTLGPCPKPMMG
ncbi:MAG: hypothetical protein NVS4B7_10280 [Ktedonobacteraceae bacterium]